MARIRALFSHRTDICNIGSGSVEGASRSVMFILALRGLDRRKNNNVDSYSGSVIAVHMRLRPSSRSGMNLFWRPWEPYRRMGGTPNAIPAVMAPQGPAKPARLICSRLIQRDGLSMNQGKYLHTW